MSYETISVNLVTKLQSRITGLTTDSALELLQYGAEKINKIVSDEYLIDFDGLNTTNDYPPLLVENILLLATASYFVNNINNPDRPTEFWQGLLKTSGVSSNSDLNSSAQQIENKALDNVRKYFSDEGYQFVFSLGSK